MIAFHIDASAHTVGQTFRLLENFLQHKVGITALLYLAEIDIHFLHCQILLLAKDAHHLQFFT